MKEFNWDIKQSSISSNGLGVRSQTLGHFKNFGVTLRTNSHSIINSEYLNSIKNPLSESIMYNIL